MTRQELVGRAASVIGQGCHYQLGAGGRLWHKSTPWNLSHVCDCTGFIAWVFGIDRLTDDPWYKQQNGGWLETSAIVRDCRTPFGIFTEVRWSEALPADVLVYGDQDGHQGHIGMVSEVGTAGPLSVIHCSAGNDRHHGDAIAQTGPELWIGQGGIVARSKWIDEEVA